MNDWKIYLGPPGTGKTSTLLTEVENLIKDGCDPRKIAYVSFTRQAVFEAIRRTGTPAEELPYFRTIHSLGFRLTGISTVNIMQPEHYKELGKKIGIELTGNFSKRRETEELCHGDQALALIENSRSCLLPLEQVWRKAEMDIDWVLLDFIARALVIYKKNNFLLDYTGILEKYLAKGNVPQLDAFIIDEAQDLSPLQWEVVRKLTSNCPLAIAAGDDDQAIYRWTGASPEILVDLSKRDTTATTVLNQSWRLPKNVWQFATKISGKIKNRIDKKFLPRDARGILDFRASMEDVDLSKDDWLLLFRNRYLAKEAVEHCRREGFYYDCFLESAKGSEAIKAAFAWEDLRHGKTVHDDNISLIKSYISIKKTDLATKYDKPWHIVLDLLPADEVEYIRAMRRRGEQLTKKPRIRIDTIHGAKGSECNNVVLSCDIAYKTFNGMLQNEDDEWRVFYVGATRAREKLIILKPLTPYCLDLEAV
jgi:superfamily I DNA/RNA helicase